MHAAQDILGIIVMVLSIITGLVGIVSIMIIKPLDRKLQQHTRDIIREIDKSFVQVLTDRVEMLENKHEAHGRSWYIWARTLVNALGEQGMHSLPNPDLYKDGTRSHPCNEGENID